jgi:murein DD-endopeptidase MepM/ murein hydrolase activator NlpD
MFPFSRLQRCFRPAPPPRRRRPRTLSVEVLEDRATPANLAIVSTQLIDGHSNPAASLNIGEEINPQVTWSTTGLPSTASYTINFTVDNVTQTTPALTLGAGAAGIQTFTMSLGGWYASPGPHTVTITLNPAQTVVETDYSDDASTFSFTPHAATDLPSKLLLPLGGGPFRDWTIVNYVDVNPLAGKSNDFSGGPDTTDGSTGHDYVLPTFAAQDAGVPVFAAAAGTVTNVVDGNYDRQTTLQNNVTDNEVDLDIGNGWTLQYLHFAANTITVSVGDQVTAGQVLGLVGSSGNSTRSQVHFQLEHNGDVVEEEYDPTTYWAAPLRYQDTVNTITDLGFTGTDPFTFLPERPPEIDSFRQAPNEAVWVWFSGNMRSGDRMDVKWSRPDGTVFSDFQFTSQQNRGGYQKASINLPSSPDLGAWQVAVTDNGTLLAQGSFQVTSTGVGAVDLTTPNGTYVSPGRTTPIDFGTVAQGDTDPQITFTLENTGTGPLQLGNLTVPPGFLFPQGTFNQTVAAGTSTTFTLLLDSATPGVKSGEIRFATDDPNIPSFAFAVTGTVTGTPAAGAPVLTLPGPAAFWATFQPPAVIAGAATVDDSDSTNFNTGSLTVDLAFGGRAADVLGIANQGTGTGQIGVSGNTVTFAGTTIGTVTGGSGVPLVVQLNASATVAAVQALVQAVTFANTSPTPAANERLVRFTLIDDTGNVSNLATKTVVVQAAGVQITESDGSTDLIEGDISDTYTVALTSQPNNPVTVTFTADPQLVLSSTTLTFTAANWSAPQTVFVSAPDDHTPQPLHHDVPITGTTASADANYNGLTVPPVVVHVTDIDIPGLVFNETGGSTDVIENATTDTYGVALAVAPTANVTVTLTSDGELKMSPSTLTFTPSNWSQLQTVTVSAPDDHVAQGYHVVPITHTTSSNDPVYKGVTATVNANLTDTDFAGLVIAESGGSTVVTEGGAADSYTVSLTNQPSANVTVTFAPDPQLAVSPATLTFTPINWNRPQTVTVSAPDEHLALGNHVVPIGGTTSSNDAAYNGLSVGPINVLVQEPGGNGNGAVPGDFSVTLGPVGRVRVRHGKRFFSVPSRVAQVVTIVNISGQTLQGPLVIVLGNLIVRSTFKHHRQVFQRTGIQLIGSGGFTQLLAPVGSPFANISVGQLSPGQGVILQLLFSNPRHLPLTYTPFVYSATGTV